jgi:hypothetical protein
MAITLKKAKKIQKKCLKYGIDSVAQSEGVSVDTIRRYVNLADKAPTDTERVAHSPEWLNEATKRDYIKAHTPAYINDIKPSMRNDEHNRILVIGDLHTPFDYEPYLNHCIAVYEKYQCNRVVFIGDVIDNHFSSYHETSADGLGGKDELDLAIQRLERWYEAFPVADVTIGNHDRMVSRKAQTSNITSRWIRGYVEVLGTSGWNFTNRVDYDGVQYIHGEGGTARTRAKKDLISTVQGHLHAQCYVDWAIGDRLKIFAMQVGCGIEKDSYGMAYAKEFPNPAIACGVVLNGKVAINEVLSTRGDIS